MITIVDLYKKFNSQWVTKGVNLTIPTGEITCIIGRSGEGKSVLLKQIIGLIKPTSGDIIIDNVSVTNLRGNALHEVFKKCGYVFQSAALLDSITVLENVVLPLAHQLIPPKKLKDIAVQKLAMVNIGPEVLDKLPSSLSGGMKKRIGIARTLMNDPSIILYDEPTSGLDPINSRIVHELIQSMRDQFGITSVVISHELEIFKYVYHVALLHEGTIKYVGSAHSIWEAKNPYIYQFIRGLSKGPILAEKPMKHYLS